MAKIDQGILGGYSGRIGNVVGYYRKGKWCVRAYLPTINDAKTEAQLQQRSIFKAMIQFASSTLEPIRLGFKQASDIEEITECNLFMRENSRCFRHEGGRVEVDYAGLQFSKGDLPGVVFTGLTVEADGRVAVQYEPNRSSARAKMEDRVHVLAYLPSAGRCVCGAPSARRSKQAAFMLPSGWASGEVHFFGFTLADDGSASGTTYLGTSLLPLTQSPDDNAPGDNKQNPSYNDQRTTDTLSGAYRSGSPRRIDSRGEP